MKKLFTIVSSFLILCFCVSTSHALIDQTWNLQEYNAWGRTYAPQDLNTDGNPDTWVPNNTNPYDSSAGQNLQFDTYTTPDGSEDAFAVGRVGSIVNDADGSFDFLWSGTSGPEITLFMYGADDVYLSQPFGTQGNSELFTTNFTIDVYMDDTQDYDSDQTVNTARTSFDQFNTVTDGTKLFTLTGHTQYMDYPTLTRPFEVLESGDASTGQFSALSAIFDVVPGSGIWADLYDTDAASTGDSNSNSDFRLNFALQSVSSSNHDWNLDNGVTADAAKVPEPATMLLFGTGLLGLAAFSRKKFFN